MPERTTFIAALAALTTACPIVLAETPPDLDARLEKLVGSIEAKRVEQHVVGLSLAVVIDDRVVLARGFGLQSLEDDEPATEDTLYAIGSTTKAFTSALVATMIDAGEMQWDDHVRLHLPDFRLSDPEANENIAIRDLLCHRSGLIGADLMWAGGNATWEDMLPCMARAEPIAKFRTEFHYQNNCYVAAGKALEAVSGKSWHDLVTERFIVPLGMTSTTTTYASVQSNDHFSSGYMWEDYVEREFPYGVEPPADEDEARERGGRWERVPMRHIDLVGPAGSINSSVVDMANWVRLQLARGEFEGRRIIEDARFDEMRESQIRIGAGVDYGLGWMLRDWNGMQVVEHGGNIDGFAAEVALLPEMNAGFVLLTNASLTGIQQQSVGLVFDALYGTVEDGVEAFADIERFLGTYDFDLQNSEVTAGFKDGHLTLDIPGQMVFTLTSPDENGRRDFSGFPIGVDFIEDEQGQVTKIALHQGGATYFMHRQGLDVPYPERATLDPLVGTYARDGGGGEVEIKVNGEGRLMMVVPSQPNYVLDPPDEEDWWHFRSVDGFQVRFERGEDGRAVTGLTSRERGREIALSRVGGPDPAAVGRIAGLEEVNELVRVKRGADAYLNRIHNVQMTGTINFVNQGIIGDIDVIFAGFDRFRQAIDLDPFGTILHVAFGNEGWQRSSILPDEDLEGEELEGVQLLHPALLLCQWEEFFTEGEVLGRETIEVEGADRDCWLVRLQRKELPEFKLWIGVKDGLARRSVIGIPLPTGGSLTTMTDYEDWRDVEGVGFPFRSVTRDDARGRIVVQTDAVTINQEFDWEPFVVRD